MSELTSPRAIERCNRHGYEFLASDGCPECKHEAIRRQLILFARDCAIQSHTYSVAKYREVSDEG